MDQSAPLVATGASASGGGASGVRGG
jgi:hypothetical protein